MKSPARSKVPILLLLMILVALQPALAYNNPLSSEAIREAYFLGKRNDEQTAAFFLKYVHALPEPKSGPYVSSIGIDTPYSAIVRRAQRAPIGYHAEEAEQEFLGKGGTFSVFVEIDFTASYPDPAQFSAYVNGAVLVPDFWKDFKIQLTQDRKVEAQSVRGGPIYSDYAIDEYGLAGAEVELEFDPAKIDPSVPATVDVLTPDGQDVQTTFDLAELR
ncbi:MAG TPA: hypothetical protein VHX49_03615 [Candidatus Acidoferrales bacterium]|jgi:hypothetical protein|nr:hypothetical protein [Candidatus Acidoferrales bacterium]